jgi:phosphotransferase system HPr (HPr) family protein
VHSVVSFDFSTTVIPGWHATIFPPYFVAGAIFGGFATVLTIMIPACAMYKPLHDLVTVAHVDKMCKIIVLTGSIVGYAYMMELFMAWYSVNPYERAAKTFEGHQGFHRRLESPVMQQIEHGLLRCARSAGWRARSQLARRATSSPREKHHREPRQALEAETHSSIVSNPLAVVRALLANNSNGATSLVRVATLNCMRKEVEIVNKLGLHARPASEFVRCVIRFKSTITICKGEENFWAASILEVLSANVDCGDRIVLEAVGPDDQEALNELEALLLRFRDEEGAQRDQGSTGTIEA